MNDALTLKGVTKRYEDFTLDHIDLVLPSGCIMGLIGENGAGKSTTIKLILDLIHRDGGEVTVLGRDNRTQLKEVKDELGVVLDESSFPDTMRLSDIDLVMKNIYRNWDGKTFRAYAKRFGLPEKKTVKEYSHGMRMKLGIAVALSHKARLLILDEATSGLDPIIRDEILDVFLEFIQDENRSILISSHIISDLEKVCDYIAFIHQGKLVFCRAKDELLEEYGILKCTAEEFARIDRSAVRGYRENSFGVEALVERRKLSGKHLVERAGIEDVMLYQIKEKMI